MDALEPDEGRDDARRGLHTSTARLATVGAALVVVAFMVLSVSRAAFTTTTDNPSNQISTGTIALLDDDAGTALFDNLLGVLPLVPQASCIHVDYTGSIDPQPIQLYISGTPTGLLDDYLDLTIEIGADNADAFGACTSFVADSTLYTGTLDGFASTHDSYANGLTAWDPSGAESRTFRITLTVQDVPAAEGLTSGFGFTWETRSS